MLARAKKHWDEAVQQMTRDCGKSAPPSFVDHIHISAAEDSALLGKAREVMEQKMAAYECHQREQERCGRLTAPQPVVQIHSLLGKPPACKPPKKKPRTVSSSTALAGAHQKAEAAASCTALVPGAGSLGAAVINGLCASTAIVPSTGSSSSSALVAATSAHGAVPAGAPPLLSGITVPPDTLVYLSPGTWQKHPTSALGLFRAGCVVADEIQASHRIYATKLERDQAPKTGGATCSLSTFLGGLRAGALAH